MYKKSNSYTLELYKSGTYNIIKFCIVNIKAENILSVLVKSVLLGDIKLIKIFSNGKVLRLRDITSKFMFNPHMYSDIGILYDNMELFYKL